MALNRISLRAMSSTLRSQTPRVLSTRVEYQEYVPFPRNAPGLDISLNWSLNKNGVTPFGDAYRWTKAANAKKFGATTLEIQDEPAAPEATQEDGALSYAQFDAALEQVKDLLSSESTLFVAEGESPDDTKTPTRVISDDSSVAATAISNILGRMPRPMDAVPLTITCYMTPRGETFEGFIVEGGDGHIYDESEMVASVVLTGDACTPGKLSATISRAASALSE